MKAKIGDKIRSLNSQLEEIEWEIQKLEAAESYMTDLQIKANWSEPTLDTIHQAVRFQLSAMYRKKEGTQIRINTIQRIQKHARIERTGGKEK